MCTEKAACGLILESDCKLQQSSKRWPRLLAVLAGVLLGFATPGKPDTIHVPAGGNFQAALIRAKPGDVIELQAGATYVGNFILPNKPGSTYITIETSAISSLPPENSRVNPSYAKFMPKLVSPNVGPVVAAKEGSHHYRFVGIEFCPAPGKWEYDIVRLGTGDETSLSQLPHHFVFDRVYIHGDPKAGSKRGIALNSATTTVKNSTISGIGIVGQEGQAICGWNGPGPFNIINNDLEAAGENILFGGALAKIQGVVPSNIIIRHNHIFKPLSWKADSPTFAGIPWAVKNLLELKNARHVVIDGNIIENNWVMAQHGTAVVINPRDMYGKNPWAVDDDITITNNIIRHSLAGIDVAGTDDASPQKTLIRLHRLLISDNLVYDLDWRKWGKKTDPGDWVFMLINGSEDLTINHNTGFSTQTYVRVGGTLAVNSGFTFTNNIVLHGTYGFFGSGAGEGKAALNKYFRDFNFRGNVIVGGSSALYPAGNFFPPSLSRVRFQDLKEGELSLLPKSPYYLTSTDGKPAGADMKALLAATAGVIDGNYPNGMGSGNPP
jgi:hypothetical protein